LSSDDLAVQHTPENMRSCQIKLRMLIKILELKDFGEEMKLSNSDWFIDSSTFYDETVK